jgi:LPS sulfotransferase NodH
MIVSEARGTTEMHEKKIRHFLDYCRYQGGQKVEKRLVILGFVNRSGSNMIGDLLAGLDGVSGFREQLNHQQVKKFCTNKKITNFPEYILNIATKQDGHTFGIKASADQIRMLARWNIDDMFRDVKMIHVMRNDVVAQAVSLHFARYTQQWSVRHTGKDVAVPYDYNSILNKITAINDQNSDLRLTCSVLNIPVHTVLYEDFVAAKKVGIMSIGRFLNMDLDLSRINEESQFQKQESAKKADMVLRFKNDFFDRWMREGAE